MAKDPNKPSYKQTLNLPQTPFAMEAKLVTNEPPRLAKWQEAGLYQKLIASRPDSKRWVLHDGPPFANGDIHIGHVINKTLKDVVLRWKSMCGFQTPYVPGWDCHGLPIEHKISEELGSKIREMSKVDVRRMCWDYASRYATLQSEQFQRLGILGDWANPYWTMKPAYEASTLEVFARFVEAGLVYKQLKPVPWSIANQTALADAELEYQDVTDPSIYVEFPAVSPVPGVGAEDRAAYLVWTTTPWTLPANLAIAIHPDVQYALVKYTRLGTSRLGILAADLVEKVMSLVEGTSPQVIKTLPGKDLLGLTYQHPFIPDRTGKLVAAEYVTTTDGTGLVHTAPGHGADDYETGMREKLDIYSPVLANGRFDDTVPEFIRGKHVTRKGEGNDLIIAHLTELGLLFKQAPVVHSYPHDWRSKTPIIFRATEQWFVGVDKPYTVGGKTGEKRTLRDRAMEAVSGKVDFVPKWGQSRITGMLQSRPDWCVSRQRVWGLPIPVFYNQAGQSLLTPESVRAVAKRFAEKGSEAWFTDSPAELLGSDFKYPEGFDAATLRKETDIFDVWFESGSSWNGVLNARADEMKFPADLYLEGSDQHRGWFQLSLLPALGATGVAPYKQVLTHGFAVKPDGTKWSKSEQKSNADYPLAIKMINTFGADLLRLWCCSMEYEGDIPASFSSCKDFGDKYRKIRNTLRYLLSNLYDFDPAKDSQPIEANSLDGWALAQLDTLVADVTAAYDSFIMHKAFRLLHDFCSVQISSVYGNAMKDRLYCEAPNGALRRRSQTVMHQMVIALTKLLAPMLVYTADEAWEQITHKPAGEADLPSVHMAMAPVAGGVAKASDAVAEEWSVLMNLRDAAMLQLDGLKKEKGMNKAIDAEVVYKVPNQQWADRLAKWDVDLEDLVGAGCYSIAIATDLPDGKPAVQLIDRREDYPACARSWKRRQDVGQNLAYPDLSARDAAAVASLANG